jgi:hypothetical protein
MCRDRFFAGQRWLIPVILATWEAEIWRIAWFKANPGK